MAQTMTVPGWSAWSNQIPRMAQAVPPGRATGAHSASPVAIRVPQASVARGQQSLSPAGPRSHAQSPATLRGAGVGTSHSAVVAGGRPMVSANAPAAQTTRNRPPPQEYMVQQGLYRRPHHSLPPQGAPQGAPQGQVVAAGRQSLPQQQPRVQPQQYQHRPPAPAQLAAQRPPAPAPQSRPSAAPFAEPLANLPVHYNVGGSSASAPKRQRRRDHADFSDDDELAPSRSFNQMKLSLLVRCICCIHQEILRKEESLPPEAQELRELYNEERFHRSNCHTDLRGWRKSLGDTNPIEIAAFILGLFENGFFEVSELICCLIFLRRFREKTGLRLDPTCWRPLFVAALLVTDKYLIDSSVKGSSMAEQSMFPVLTPGQVFSLELAFWKKLDYGRLWLNRQHFKAFCQELEFNVQDSLEVARFVKSHNYVRSDTFTWGESHGHELLLDYAAQQQAASHLRAEKTGGSVGQLPARPSNGITGKPVQPWKPRQTVYAQAGHQDELQNEDADAMAIRDGVSPRRKADKVSPPPVTYCNGSKPRASSHTFVGERNPSHGAQLQKHGGSPQAPTLGMAEDGSRLRQSPRRPQQVSSGPCLFASTAHGAAREVQFARDDPSLLSFAEKTHMFNARSQSQGDPSSRRPSRPTPVQQITAPQPGALRPGQGPAAGSGLNGYDPSRGFVFAPNSRNTIPMSMKPCVQPPAPATITRSAAATPQQLTPPGPNQAQIYGGLHPRGRSASPAYNGGPGFIAAAVRHAQPVTVYRR